MDQSHDTDFTSSEEGRALLAEANRRFKAILDILPPWMREGLDQQAEISQDEANAFLLAKLVLDALLMDAAVWQEAKKLIAPRKLAKKHRHGPNGSTRAARLIRLVQAYDDFPQPAGAKGARAKLGAFLLEEKALLVKLRIEAGTLEVLNNRISDGRAAAYQRADLRKQIALGIRDPQTGRATSARTIVKETRAASGSSPTLVANMIGTQLLLDLAKPRNE